MSSNSIKSMKELMDSFLAKTTASHPQSSNDATSPPSFKDGIQDKKLEKVLIDLFSSTCLPYFKYGYCREGCLIIGIKNASWATRLKLLQLDIIRRYNQELKSSLYHNHDGPYNEKTLITRLIIKVSPN